MDYYFLDVCSEASTDVVLRASRNERLRDEHLDFGHLWELEGLRKPFVDGEHL